MSQESTVEAPRGLIARVRQALFGLPQKPTKYAHPWTAYSPVNFQANMANGAAGGTAIPCISKPEQSAATDLVCQRRPAEVIKLVEVTCPTVKPDVRRASCLPAPVKLKLIESQPVQALAATPPALAAMTGHDFQLAARLRSVSTLNRVLKVPDSAPTAKASGRNRPIAVVAARKRLRRIEPPAVRLKNRTTAQVVQLRLAFARAMADQSRARKAA